MSKIVRHVGIVLGVVIASALVAIAYMLYAGRATSSMSSPYSAMFGNFVEIGADWNPGPGKAEITNVSFTLPVDAYVYVASSGEVTFASGGKSSSGSASVWIAVDEKSRTADWDTYRFHEGGFSVSSIYKLKKGSHTAYVMGLPRENSFGYLSANIVVIAAENGTIGKNSWFIQ
jgi:hypothetical protein